MATVSTDPDAHLEARAGPATGLFQSLTHFLGTLLAIARTRLELLTTELQEEVQQVAKLLAWTFVATFAAMMALLLAALSVIFAFWDTHRVLASIGMVALFAIFAIAATLILLRKLRAKPPLLDATLTELAKDRDQLRARLRHE
jgi:uncharacterized membrane protein YqjE